MIFLYSVSLGHFPYLVITDIHTYFHIIMKPIKQKCASAYLLLINSLGAGCRENKTETKRTAFPFIERRKEVKHV